MHPASVSYTQVFISQLKKDLYLSALKRSEWMNPLIFLVLVQSLFPLALGADPALLEKVAPALLWVSALLSTLISLETLFQEDFEDGCLEQMLLAGPPFYVFCMAKLFCHWLVSGAPLIIICPLLAASFYMEGDALWVMAFSLLLATPCLSCISALASALTLNARRGGVLLSLIVLPLYIPILVFGSGAIIQSLSGESPQGALLMLAAFLLLGVSLAPFALSAALKLSISDS